MRKLLADVFDFVPATTVDEALQLIVEADADRLSVSVTWEATSVRPCSSLEIASKALGAEMFIDLFALKQRVGVAKADKELRRLLGVVMRRMR